MLLFQGRAVSPLYALSILQEALKSVRCHGDERQEQEELSTSPNRHMPKQGQIAKGHCPKVMLDFKMELWPCYSMLYNFDKSEFCYSKLYTQM